MRSDGFKKTESADSNNIGSVIRNLKRNCDVRLCSEVVNFVREDSVEPTTERGSVREIGVVKLHMSLVSIVWIDIDVIDSLCVEV